MTEAMLDLSLVLYTEGSQMLHWEWLKARQPKVQQKSDDVS